MNSQLLYAAFTIYHEARGESIEGQVAVAHVILNRVKNRRISIQEVVFQPEQFSCFNEGCPPVKDYRAFIIAVEALKRCRVERMKGNTLDGADHYFNPSKVDPPSWSKKMRRVAIIGSHEFFRS